MFVQLYTIVEVQYVTEKKSKNGNRHKNRHTIIQHLSVISQYLLFLANRNTQKMCQIGTFFFFAPTGAENAHKKNVPIWHILKVLGYLSKI